MPEVGFAEMERLDAELVALVRGGSSTRLALGKLLEEMHARSAHHELGFSTIAAYARERSGRSARWALESRLLARRLEKLPALRTALQRGEVGWCMAELVARHATLETDAELAARAATSTVRALRAHFASAAPSQNPISRLASRLEADLEKCTLSVSMSQEDAWRFEWMRRFAEHVAGSGVTDTVIEALLAETFDTFNARYPGELLDVGLDDAVQTRAAGERAWREQLAAWREEWDKRCEPNFAERLAWHGVRPAEAPELPARSPEEMDARVVELAKQLARRDVRIARAAKRFHEVEGWRRLGYSSEAQYARERLGISVSCLKARIALGRRLHRPVFLALERGELRYQSALLITRVATDETAHEWVARAKQRTVKHLWEDVRAAELVSGVGGPPRPPSETTVRAVHDLEARLLAGERDAVLELGGQMSARLAPDVGRVTARLWVARDTARFWRDMERRLRRHLAPATSFARVLCDAFWDAWKHLTQNKPKYGHIYDRDRQRCTNPVCDRHDLTPHHVKFRSRGGTDEDENVTSLCVFCHLEGVHQGRLDVSGRVPDLRWEIGRNAAVVVEGRTLVPTPS